jgi:hypothetical protein
VIFSECLSNGRGSHSSKIHSPSETPLQNYNTSGRSNPVCHIPQDYSPANRRLWQTQQGDLGVSTSRVARDVYQDNEVDNEVAVTHDRASTRRRWRASVDLSDHNLGEEMEQQLISPSKQGLASPEIRHPGIVGARGDITDARTNMTNSGLSASRSPANMSNNQISVRSVIDTRSECSV